MACDGDFDPFNLRHLHVPFGSFGRYGRRDRRDDCSCGTANRIGILSNDIHFIGDPNDSTNTSAYFCGDADPDADIRTNGSSDTNTYDKTVSDTDTQPNANAKTEPNPNAKANPQGNTNTHANLAGDAFPSRPRGWVFLRTAQQGAY